MWYSIRRAILFGIVTWMGGVTPSLAEPSRAEPLLTEPLPTNGVLSPVTPAFASPPAAAPRPGARSLLEACWEPEGLRGTFTDHTIYFGLPDLQTPPVRTTPLHSLQPLPEGFARSIRYVMPPKGEKLVALTFDLSEKATEVTGYDADIVNVLRDQHAKATFFAGGKWLRTHPEKGMQLIADPLFEIGNDTWTYGDLRILHDQEGIDQVLWAQAEYELLRERLLALPCAAMAGPEAASRIPPVPKVFRFPYGICDAKALASVASMGLYPIQWNIMAGDPARTQTAGRIVHSILSQIRPGSIVVAHANGRGWHTAEALTALIPELRRRGYRFVTVSELLFTGQPMAAEDCYESQPGDTLRYEH